ncbi:16S rRNA (guanine(966)-N(2))-methyltransferase RsmD [Caldibacillus lycopersici]|uniref:16S rRNA (Guanine(966)-N(2))-methyltransferase RsmD n=1 Tax=Perspicuibacillus lycopersici TaxID=1325689 RepID=A0AAE3LLS4_9BACI|nr:16S rRNA (guanine(966)-N(2))-methyltransferase RsmD [Perspicuibacillus lycopersici]MCU9612221.1 16S rRNA (guanine(966)-N(2))-methyltransferase RsmD [Perspicuibacillus lycopersici]
MRVVSGSQKGRILKAVPGNSTRPTTDKVKEAVFNMIGPYFDDGNGLDLFAGSGNLGIEGISRGLDKVIFVDHDGKAIQTIKQNLDLCGFRNQAEVFKNDWKRALKAVINRSLIFRVIWLDPPYKNEVYTTILREIDKHQLLENHGVIVCEHAKEVDLPNQVGEFVKWKYEVYGTIAISIYQKGKIEED